MKYIKIPHNLAQDILKLYEAGESLLAITEEEMTPYELVEKALQAELYSDIITFIAHGLPIREAVWWCCSCAMQRDDWSQVELEAIHAAKAWVNTPDETSRRYAESAAKSAKLETAAGWAAQAAFWSGGSMIAPNEPVVPPLPYLYAQAVAGCINLCAVLPDGEKAKERYQDYLQIGVNIANGGNGELSEEE